MTAQSVKLYTLNYSEMRTYLFALLFIVGNIVLPQLCHLVPQGGLMLLPIYFFTLVAAYKYGWKVGLLTAIASPIVNSLIFGMPAWGVLPAILLKSVLLATAAGYAAKRFQHTSLQAISLKLAYNLYALAVQSLVAVFYLYGVHGPAHGQRERRAQAVVHPFNACGANAEHGLRRRHLVNTFPLNRLHLRGWQVARTYREPHQAQEIVLYFIVHIT